MVKRSPPPSPIGAALTPDSGAESRRMAASPETLTRRPSSSTALRDTPAMPTEPPPAMTCMPRAQWAAVTTMLWPIATPLQ